MKKAKTDFKKQGKRNRASGARFERKVRADLESKGWVVIKNPNNVIDEKFKQGKSKYNPFTKALMMNSGGFPDFVCIRDYKLKDCITKLINKNTLDIISIPQCMNIMAFEVIAVECKTNGQLSKEEKEKCVWLLSNQIFSKILIASKGEKRGEVVYKEFK